MALICAVIWTAATNAFVHTMTRRLEVSSITRLSTSLSTPTGTNFTSFHDGDRGTVKKSPSSTIKIVPAHQIDCSEDYDQNDQNDSPDFNEFHRHLKRVSFKVRNSKTRATLMDDELKRLETKFYKLTGDDGATRTTDSPKHSYQGSIFRPDSKCYAMVINAYAKSGHGRTQAILAEETCRRFEKFNPDAHANAFMMKGVMKAWLGVGDLKKAEEWLMKMEASYARTLESENAPDMMSYTLFLEALALSNGDYEAKAGPLSLKILGRMRSAYLRGRNLLVMPTLRTYLSVMRCQERSYRGIVAVNKLRDVLEQLEKDYEAFGRPDSCTPNAQAVMSVINAASKCRGNMQAILIMEEVIQNLQKRFEMTGELEYRPIDQMYTLLLSAYSKVNAENAPICSNKVGEFLAMMSKNDMSPSIYATTAGTYQCSEQQANCSLFIAIFSDLLGLDIGSYKSYGKR